MCKNKTYCTLPHRGTSKTCAQLVHDNPSNRFAALAKYARGKQKGFYSNATGEYSRPTSKIPKYIYDRKKIDQLYSDWQDELSIQYNKCKHGNDYESFEKWINENYFTASMLLKLGIKKINPLWEKKNRS